ncbi:PREDICTED: putative F-box protein At1g70970 [Brassica oleracea var. oleracea]|uniref:putative F-box protein At1g70970 n=1 Tax=Brassica oleracea var. oleracea TaxID=109376 RepID=UPI0006A6DD75|nr:PREDICTED: putative F-box protein At1g70970 [Brassica oleracea var. oleracea]
MENSDFAMMPEELKDVIRSKLPPKSLARCIVVSKEWERSIGDRRLQHAHYQESKKQPMLVLLRLCQRRVWNDGEPQYESFNTVNQERPQPIADPHHVTTLPNSDFAVTSGGPIRGLLCLHYDRYLVLCNPAIRKCLTVLEFEPEPPQTRKRFNHRGFLFGFDEQSKAFKVIKTEAGDHNLPWRHQIFTVQPGEVIWRQIDCPRPYTPITNSLSIEGNVYLGAAHNKTCLAVTVNLTTESILITELPTAFLLKLGITKLRSYNGQPCLVSAT